MLYTVCLFSSHIPKKKNERSRFHTLSHVGAKLSESSMTVLSLTADPGVDRCNSNSESLEIKDVLEILKMITIQKRNKLNNSSMQGVYYACTMFLIFHRN